MKIIECEQGSTEWFQARLGIPTASNFNKIVTTKGEPSKQAQKYMYQLVAEWLAGEPVDAIETNVWMQRGIDQEDFARKEYSFITENDVIQVGFCLSDCGIYGASPDGLVGNDGLLEIKCPKATTLVEYYRKGFPSTYFQQVQGQMLVCDAEWCDFIASHTAMVPYRTRVERDKDFVLILHKRLRAFNDKLKELKEELKDYKV